MSSLNGCTAGSRWIERLYRDKTAALGRVSPAVLIVGGSGTHFGMSARQLRRAGIPAVNFGTHAGLGLPYLLQRALDAARPGDVVLLMPEYEHYRDEGRVDDALLEYAACQGPSQLAALPKMEVLRRLFTTSAKQLLQNVAANDARRYKIGTADEFGDETINTRAARRATDLPFIHRQALMSIPQQVSPQAGAAIEGFVGRARSRHVAVVVTWPGLYRGAAPSSDHVAGIEAFWKRVGVPVIGCYGDALLDDEDMFDTVYHANVEGAERHTRRLQPYLAAYLRGDIAHATCKADSTR